MIVMSWKWSWPNYLSIWRCPKSFMPFGWTKIALALERFILTRNLEKFHRANGQRDWATTWWREVIWILEGLEKISAIMEQDKIYLLHKLKFWTESKNWRWAHMEAWHELYFGGGLWYDDMRDHAKWQLICICRACTSFTTTSLRQELWKIIIK